MTPFELHLNLRVGVPNSCIGKVSLGIPCAICDNIGSNSVTVWSLPFWSLIMTLAVETVRHLESLVKVPHFDTLRVRCLRVAFWICTIYNLGMIRFTNDYGIYVSYNCCRLFILNIVFNDFSSVVSKFKCKRWTCI